MNRRVEYIDIARGIAIILMIVGHVVQNTFFRHIIFSFHMPLFIIVSGYFYKDRPLKKEIKNVLLKLIIPTTVIVFLVTFADNLYHMNYYNSLFNSLKSIVVCWSHQSKIIYHFNDTGVLWFIYLLCIMRLLFSILKRIIKENDFMIFIVALLISYIGYTLGQNGYWLPWSFDVTCATFIFYFIGYLLKKYKYMDLLLSNYYILFVLAIIWIIGINNDSIEIAVRHYPGGLWSFFIAISGTIIVLKISEFISKRLNCFAKILSWYGKNSMYVLYGHYFDILYIDSVFIFFKNISNKFVVSSIKILISSLVACLLKISNIIFTNLKLSNSTKNKVRTKYDCYFWQIKYNRILCIFRGKKYIVMKYYYNFYKYKYNINSPNLFTEKINSRKIEKNDLYSIYTDKLRLREYVAKTIGDRYLIPVICVTKKLTTDIYCELPNKFVIKTSKGYGTTKIIYNKKNEDEKHVLKLVRKYQKTNFSYIWGEFFYKNKKNRIIIEKLLLSSNGELPIKYGIHCFNSDGINKKYIQEIFNDPTNCIENIYDERFNRLLFNKKSEKNKKCKLRKTEKIKEMLEVSDKLSSSFDYVRVDFYYVDDTIFFDKFVFVPSSGFLNFANEKVNKIWGDNWR